MIDDFCVKDPSQWATVGHKLLNELKNNAKDKDTAQILIVCGAHDNPKRQFLKKNNLSIGSEWCVGGIPPYKTV